jgi:hypothetical protein
MAIAAIVIGIAVPAIGDVTDASRVRHAAGFVAARFRAARQLAVVEERSVAVVFDQSAAGWSFRICADGNGNGVRRAELGGVDSCRDGPHLFSALFPGVAIASDAGIAGPEGSAASTDPVRFGASDMASFSPLGSCTAGSLYLRSAHGAQYAIRVSGVLGRTRVLRYDAASQSWKDA